MQLLTYTLVTIGFVAAGLCWLRLFAIMIAPGQVFDMLFNWQDMLTRLYQSPKKWKNLLGKALGDCEVCTAYWFQPIWFAAYYVFCRLALHYFITDEVGGWAGKIAVGLLWYLVFHGIGAVGGMLTLVRAKMKAARNMPKESSSKDNSDALPV